MNHAKEKHSASKMKDVCRLSHARKFGVSIQPSRGSLGKNVKLEEGDLAENRTGLQRGGITIPMKRYNKMSILAYRTWRNQTVCIGLVAETTDSIVCFFILNVHHTWLNPRRRHFWNCCDWFRMEFYLGTHSEGAKTDGTCAQVSRKDEETLQRGRFKLSHGSSCAP
jgi:hypothetical protein